MSALARPAVPPYWRRLSVGAPPRNRVAPLRLPRAGSVLAWAVALAAVVAGSALVRLHYGLGDRGIYWPDEIHQSVEQAHRLIYGYGLVPWEFIRGARSWAFPGMLALVLWVGRAVGVSD